jgi:hypothetical protein
MEPYRSLTKATITVKNIPDELYDLLKQSAEANHHSINSEIIVLSSNAYAPAVPSLGLGGGGWVIDPEGGLALTSTDQPFLTVEIELAIADTAKNTYPRYVSE